MTKVPTSHARLGSHHSSTADRIRAQRKKPYKTVLEYVVREKKALHTEYCFSPEPPPDYTFVPPGQPKLTDYCKDLCRQRELTVYAVSERKNRSTFEPTRIAHHVHRIGYHFPNDVVSEACSVLGYYCRDGVFHKRSSRLAQALADQGSRLLPQDRAATETETKGQIGAAIRDLFPKIPVWDLNAIVNYAFKEGTARVGNAKDMSLPRRVQLAVGAHIRHNYTEYDNLLKVGKLTWLNARDKIEPASLAKLQEWRDENDTDQMDGFFREVIVLDDDDETAVEVSDNEPDSSDVDSSSEVTAREHRELQRHDVGHFAGFEDRHTRQAPHEAQSGRILSVPTYDERYVGRAPAGERQVEAVPLSPRVEGVYAPRAPTRGPLVNDVLYSARPQERYYQQGHAGTVLQPLQYGPTHVAYPRPAVQPLLPQPRPLPPVFQSPAPRRQKPIRMVENGQIFDLIPVNDPVLPRRRATYEDHDIPMQSIERDPRSPGLPY